MFKNIFNKSLLLAMGASCFLPGVTVGQVYQPQTYLIKGEVQVVGKSLENSAPIWVVGNNFNTIKTPSINDPEFQSIFYATDSEISGKFSVALMGGVESSYKSHACDITYKGQTTSLPGAPKLTYRITPANENTKCSVQNLENNRPIITIEVLPDNKKSDL